MHHGKLLSGFLLILLSAIVCIVNASAQTTSDSFSTYYNPSEGIKIQYPSDWWFSQNSLKLSDIVGFYPPFSDASDIFVSASVTISVKHYSHVTLDEYRNFHFNSLGHGRNITIIESNPTVLAGYPADRVIFLRVAHNGLLKIESMQVFTVKDNKLYSISFSAQAAKYSVYVPFVQQMIQTFRITNSTTMRTL